MTPVNLKTWQSLGQCRIEQFYYPCRYQPVSPGLKLKLSDLPFSTDSVVTNKNQILASSATVGANIPSRRRNQAGRFREWFFYYPVETVWRRHDAYLFILWKSPSLNVLKTCSKHYQSILLRYIDAFSNGLFSLRYRIEVEIINGSHESKTLYPLSGAPSGLSGSFHLSPIQYNSMRSFLPTTEGSCMLLVRSETLSCLAKNGFGWREKVLPFSSEFRKWNRFQFPTRLCQSDSGFFMPCWYRCKIDAMCCQYVWHEPFQWHGHPSLFCHPRK